MPSKKTSSKAPTRGALTPKKADLEAFRNNQLTPAAQKMNRIVDRAFRANTDLKNAGVRFQGRMERLFKPLIAAEKGITVVSIDMKRRVTKSHKNVVRGNQRAYIAKGLIDEFIAELFQKKAVSPDEQNMGTFLAGIIQESRGRIILSQNLIEFRRMVFVDHRLQQAQKLLADAFDVSESRTYYYCEIWDEEKQKWTAA